MHGNDDQASIFRQALHFALDVVASHHVQDDVHATPIGQAQGLGRKILGLVVDRMISPQRQAGCTFFVGSSRHDNARAQGFGKQWLQMVLLEQGLARVAISPDRNECAPDFYEAESRARAKHAGIWALAGTAPKAPEQMVRPAAPSGSFQLVEGYVTTVGFGDNRVFINFGSNGQRSFTAVVAPQDRRAFRDYDFDALVAHRIRVRGTVQDFRGRPQISLSNPQQIEVLN